MSKITYEFSELEPYRGFEIYVYGEAEIFYSRQSAQPDLGINRAYWEYEVGKVWINSNKEKHMPPLRMELRQSDPLYEAIVLRLTDDTHDQWVQSAIEEYERD